ncbi:hypothetical protein M3689_14920 [Alkalihalophilus marmarensis]|jgi:hypothetical protein|uniref:hypothetical protein n=1 Tax=Alkalihalophilus marmarensis TaxID=521377 RepID=UPI002041A407|nr:hypothetical protein [Alkalihalophilus marmarensis]MCM3490605.1 hypothetical protein [Alkalihalophilus marmarensis]
MLGKGAAKTPGMNKILDKVDKTFSSSKARTIATGVGAYSIQEKIPYRGPSQALHYQLVAKEVPLYLSKDTDNWKDSKTLLFTVKPDGSHSINERKEG